MLSPLFILFLLYHGKPFDTTSKLEFKEKEGYFDPSKKFPQFGQKCCPKTIAFPHTGHRIA